MFVVADHESDPSADDQLPRWPGMRMQWWAVASSGALFVEVRESFAAVGHEPQHVGGPERDVLGLCGSSH